jgi:Ran GTPase-activating protein (RanGAP) involved in mRNA processing and transport
MDSDNESVASDFSQYTEHAETDVLDALEDLDVSTTTQPKLRVAAWNSSMYQYLGGKSMTLAEVRDDPTLDSLEFTNVDFDETVAAQVIDLIRSDPRIWKTIRCIDCRDQIHYIIVTALVMEKVIKLYIESDLDAVGENEPKDAVYQALATGLQLNQSLKSLSLNNVVFSRSQAAALRTGLKSTKTLEEFELDGCDFEAGAALELASGLRSNQSLTSLSEAHCVLYEDRALLIASLENHPKLSKLSFNDTLRDPFALDAITSLLSSGKSKVRSLALGGTAFLGRPAEELKEGLPMLTTALRNNCTLTHLNLCENGLNDDDLRTLVDVVRENPSISELDLSGNRFTDKGITYLASQLPQLCNLRSLNVNMQSFGVEGAKTLMLALQDHRELESLVLPRSKYDLQILHLLDLNKGGRKLLQAPPVPLAFWPLVLERAAKFQYYQDPGNNMDQQVEVNKEFQASVIFSLLNGGPALFEQRDHKRKHSDMQSIGDVYLGCGRQDGLIFS